MKPRIQADVTRGELVWMIAGVFLLGTIFGWAGFGELPFPEDAIKDTSIAEFMAAAGTWVIGLGAWKYARESHRHQVTEDRNRKVTLLNNMAEKARRIGAFEQFMQEFLKLEASKRTPTSLIYVLEFQREKLIKLAFTDDERSVLDDEESIFLIHSIELEIDFFRDNASYTIECAKSEAASHKEVIGPITMTWIDSMSERYAVLSAGCKKLREKAIELRKRCLAGHVEEPRADAVRRPERDTA